jgi:putative ABC transport system substrate-binding protein
MNNRRKLVLALGGALAPLGSFAQLQSKVWRIGFLGRETAVGYARELDALRGGLKDLGYVEGKNLAIEYRWAEGVNERLPQLAAELLREKVDILVTHTNAGARAASRATTTVPIVITGTRIDPVAAGLVKSLARPGGNITGVFSLSGLLTVKQLELVKDTLPKVRKVAFMIAPTMDEEMEKGVTTSAKTLKLEVQPVRVGSPGDIETAIAGMAGRKFDAIIVSPQPLFVSHFATIASLATRQRMPALGNVTFAESGGLVGYGADTLNNYRRAAYFVDRILKGANPADLPIEQPTKIELVINMKTARALGITIPQTVLVRADRIVE